MASSAGAQKIVLKNTTKISLNERFTAYRQQAQNAATFRQKSLKQASVENTRLAQQMARRPTVIAALRLKRRSLQNRLGVAGGPQRMMRRNPVKARMDFGSRATNIYRRLGQLTRGRGIVRRGGSNRGYNVRPGTSPLIKARLGQPQRGNNKKFKKFFDNRNQFQQQLQGFGRGFRGSSYFGKTRRGRGGRPQSARGGRGGRWNRGQQQPTPTKQELDTELDEYMAESKGPMESQMGAFVGSNF